MLSSLKFRNLFQVQSNSWISKCKYHIGSFCSLIHTLQRALDSKVILELDRDVLVGERLERREDQLRASGNEEAQPVSWLLFIRALLDPHHCVKMIRFWCRPKGCEIEGKKTREWSEPIFAMRRRNELKITRMGRADGSITAFVRTVYAACHPKRTAVHASDSHSAFGDVQTCPSSSPQKEGPANEGRMIRRRLAQASITPITGLTTITRIDTAAGFQQRLC